MKIDNLIAFRYLKSGKRSSILSFLSVTSVIGLMLGCASLILVVSVMSGFSDNLKSKMMGANPDILVTNFSANPIRNAEALEEKIKEAAGVKNTAQFIHGQAVVTSNAGVSGIVLKGIDPQAEKGVSRLDSFMVLGELSDLITDDNGYPAILLGRDLAFSINASIGDVITLISPQSVRGPFGINPKMRRFIVGGIFDTGVYEYNANLAYVNLKAAAEFMGMDKDCVTGIGVAADKGVDTVDLAAVIKKQIGGKYWSRDWLSMNSSLFSALKLEQFAMFIVLTLIIIVASFSIVSMIAITVKDKVKDIAILRAYGASAGFIRSVFIRQGIIVGIAGTALGNIIALVLSLLVTKYKIIKLPAEVYFMDSLPINTDWRVYLLVSVCAVFITFIASAFPSSQAAKISPASGLRND